MKKIHDKLHILERGVAIRQTWGEPSSSHLALLMIDETEAPPWSLQRGLRSPMGCNHTRMACSTKMSLNPILGLHCKIVCTNPRSERRDSGTNCKAISFWLMASGILAKGQRIARTSPSTNHLRVLATRIAKRSRCESQIQTRRQPCVATPNQWF